jgi:peptidoglycan/LPS O-acetylase OafA/YrhL
MQARRKISDIEFLRGVAVIFVIVFHARSSLFVWKVAAWDHIADNYFNLWPGVDIFFAISGFVISRSLLPVLRQSEDPTEFVRAVLVFWMRRVWRLVPSAWLWLVIMLLASAVFNRSGIFDTFHVNFESTLAAMLGLANFRLSQGFQQYVYGVNVHYWSLSLEEQFYLVLPVLVFVCRRWLTISLLAIVLVVFCLPQTTLLMLFRIHAILLGVLLAIFSEQPVFALFEPVFLRHRPKLSLVVLTIILGFIAALGVFGQQIVPLRNVDVIAVLCALLVLIASYDRNYICPHPAVRRVMQWVGSRSYALYLIHILAFFMTRELWFRLSPPGTVFGPEDALRFGGTALVLLVTFSELNFRFVELPLRKYGMAVASRLQARPLLVAAEAEATPIATSLGDSLVERKVAQRLRDESQIARDAPQAAGLSLAP